MAFGVTSYSASISGRTFTPSSEPKAPQLGSIRVFDRSYGQIQSHAVTFSQRRSSVEPVNAQPKRSESIVPSAATVVAPEVVEKVEVEDYAQLAKELENASLLRLWTRRLRNSATISPLLSSSPP